MVGRAGGARTEADDAEPRQIVLGEIAGPHGVRGWVKIRSSTEPVENILDYAPWQGVRCGQWRTLEVAEGRRHGRSVIARIEACGNRDDAIALGGYEIRVDRSRLPALESGEYYWSDLVGLEVTDSAGTSFGRIEKMFETGANDVMVVRGEVERLIPFVLGEFVEVVDVVAGRIVVHWHPDD